MMQGRNHFCFQTVSAFKFLSFISNVFLLPSCWLEKSLGAIEFNFCFYSSKVEKYMRELNYYGWLAILMGRLSHK